MSVCNGLDGAAADHQVTIVKDHSLAGSQCPLGNIKNHLGSSVFTGIDGGALGRLVVPGLGKDAQGRSQFFKWEPVPFIGNQCAVKQCLVGAHGDGILLHILGADINRCPHGKAQSLTLTQGVGNGTLVFAYHLAGKIQEISLGIVLAGVALHECHIVSIGHEADILGIMLAGVDETLCFGNGSGISFAHIAQGEQGMRQLELGQTGKYIALVLAQIRGPVQQIPSGLLIPADSGVVAGYHVVTAQFHCLSHQMVKLQMPVAVNTGIGGCAAFVTADEFGNNLILEIRLGVEYIERKAQTVGNTSRILCVIQTAAGGFLIVGKNGIVKEFQHGAHAGITLLSCQIGSHGTVHAAAHGDERFLLIHGKSSSFVISAWSIPVCRGKVNAEFPEDMT